ncbi:hypothetical protein ABZ297_35115 [Nonomuraea sp. NPDC005983]|uniref:phosphorylase family protein n=1 Tax=Nonomuraea sp. NPDC005983 TaxID=3155595 RepID=UPI0033A685A8
MTSLLICTALGIEARALREGLMPATEGVEVIRMGMGPGNAASAFPLLADVEALAVAGFGGALDEGLRPGDVVVAEEVRFDGRVLPCPSAPFVAEELAGAGLPVRTGPLVTSGQLVVGAERGRLAAQGALAVDMESGPVAAAAGGRPFAAVRVIVDTPATPLLHPATLLSGVQALRTLRHVGRALARWARRTAWESEQCAPPEEVRST